MTPGAALTVLVVDDEPPALAALTVLLDRDPRVGTVLAAGSAAGALGVLQGQDVDMVISDIRMPGLTGLELAQVLRRFRTPPRVVFVTAHDQHAVDGFGLEAVDYLSKPVRGSRLAEAIRRVIDTGTQREDEDDAIAVELGGVTRFVRRSEVLYVEAQGDYTRLHTPSGSPLVRVPLAKLEADWGDAGFVRIHRSYLVALAHVSEVRRNGGRVTVVVDGDELVVSRRHTRELRDVLDGHVQPLAPTTEVDDGSPVVPEP